MNSRDDGKCPPRLAEETDKQYRAFCCYWELGSGRSVAAAYRKYRGLSNDDRGNIPGRIKDWAKQNHWEERIESSERDKRAEESRILLEQGRGLLDEVAEMRAEIMEFTNAAMEASMMMIGFCQERTAAIRAASDAAQADEAIGANCDESINLQSQILKRAVDVGCQILNVWDRVTGWDVIVEKLSQDLEPEEEEPTIL